MWGIIMIHAGNSHGQEPGYTRIKWNRQSGF